MTESFTLPELSEGYRWGVEMDGADLCISIEQTGYSALGDLVWVPVLSSPCSPASITSVARRLADTFKSQLPLVGKYDYTGKKIL